MRILRLILGIAVFVGLLMMSRGAFAQGVREPIDVERFKPHITHDGFVMVEGSAVRPTADRWEFGAYGHYGFNQLVVVNQDNQIADRFVSGRAGFDVLGSVTLFDNFAVGLGIPFFVGQTGDPADLNGDRQVSNPSPAGLGDIRIVPKYQILDDRRFPLGLAVSAELRVPTHVGDFSGGARNVVFVPRVIADHRFGATGFRIGANAGVLIREGTRFENVNALSEFIYAAAAEYRIGGWDGLVALGAEVNGGAGLASEVHLEELPLEGVLYGKVFPTKEWQVHFGPSAGIIPGYGIPTFRFFVGVRYSPTYNDRDGDGIPDHLDKCPDVPETRNGIEDMDGCPEDLERDSDGDGIPDHLDQCPDEPETINGIEDEDGCPDEGPAKVIRKEKELVILENVEFATASAVIQPTSYSILDQVALMMKANPDIRKVRIEGHTDSRGSHQMNVWLSEARANSVRAYLIQKGIKPERLVAKGFGPDRPLVEEVDDAALQKNRRVEFHIVTD